jgi:DNA polymerase-3 subunit delta
MSLSLFYGNDEYLVDQAGQEQFGKLAREVSADWACEVIPGQVNNLSELEALAYNLTQALSTPALWGPHKLVYLKNTNLLADNPTTKAQGAQEHLERIEQALWSKPDWVTVLVVAIGVDRRTKRFKNWLEHSQAHGIGLSEGNDPLEALQAALRAQATALDLHLTQDGLSTLLERVGSSSRMACMELEKLATYVGPGGSITPQVVRELVPLFGSSDFFEPVEAFFAKDPQHLVRALRQYCFIHKELRPLVNALYNRLRLMLPLKALVQDKQLPAQASYSTLKNRLAQLQALYPSKNPAEGSNPKADAKSSYNLFSQHPFYLSKLLGAMQPFTWSELLALRQELSGYFTYMHQHPAQAPSQLEALLLRYCTAPSNAA